MLIRMHSNRRNVSGSIYYLFFLSLSAVFKFNTLGLLFCSQSRDRLVKGLYYYYSRNVLKRQVIRISKGFLWSELCIFNCFGF